jgi:competence protein ComFC
MAAINPQKIIGNWRSGFALDRHTTGSTYLGVDEHGRERFDTSYTELGELLYRLKYKSDQTVAYEIIATAVKVLLPQCFKFDLIIPVGSYGVICWYRLSWRPLN